ncbi:MAG: PTS glucose transporter subunit IIA [Traorella sp.]
MLNLFKKKEKMVACVSGKLIPISEVNDAVFSQKMMGDGYAIIPTDSKVYAPFSGTISFCFPTNHAVGIKTKEGLEFLIHMGIDTVELKGKGFKSHVAQGQSVKQGDLLVEMDLNVIKEHGYDSTVIVVFPNNQVKSLKTSSHVEHHESIQCELK